MASTSTIETLFLESATRFPTHIALTEWNGRHWRDMTYRELASQAHALSTILQARGIRSGERIILLSRNTIEAVVALLGIWLSNATAVLIDPDLPEAVIAAQCQTADARFMMAEKNHYAIDHHKAEKSDADTSTEIAAIIFTSGTTGRDKAVMLTHANFLYLTQFYGDLSTPEGCALTVLPLFHVAGLYCGILQPLFIGVRVVFFNTMDANALQFAFQAYKPTVFIGVPRLLEVLDQKIQMTVRARGKLVSMLFNTFFGLSFLCRRFFRVNIGKLFFKKIHQQFGGKLKKILCGSASLSQYLQQAFLIYGFDLFCSYGLTETCGPITFTQKKYQWRANSVGPCIDKHDLRIAESGEILYRGNALMKGYFRDPEATQSAIINGFFHTKDLGKLDRAGNVYVIGRMKELIVFADGTKAMPEAIEHQYASVLGMKEYAVFSVARNNNSIAVFAFVPENLSDADIIKQQLFQHASRLKSPYRIADVICLAEIPRSNTLKVKRHVLQAMYQEKISPAVNEDLPQDAQLRIILHCFEALMPDKKKWITPDVTFAELGIDSLLAVQLCDKINNTLHAQLKPTEFWFSSSIRALSESLQKKSPIQIISTKKSNNNDKIAIVAMTCAFPGGAHNTELFWKNLLAGKDAIEKVPATRFPIDEYYDTYALAPGKINTNQGGFIALPDDFPAALFHVKPRMAVAMDPRQKLALMQIKKISKKISSQKTGVFIGTCFDDFATEQIKKLRITAIAPHTGIGMADFSLAGQIAYHFGFTGPAMIVNTACSSSLVATHLAVRALQAGECDAAIAGGVNLILSPEVSVCLSTGGFLSPDGRCKTFDESANGYVRSEGVGFVVLKRYEDALKDQEDILSVIVGSSVNQNGASTNFSAPNGEAQIACYQAALAAANVLPNQVGYIEAHGSGTQLGDAIEMQSIQRVYDQQRSYPLYVGAVKSSIGHCEAAAGIAGLMKTIHVLQHQMIPPNLHYHTSNRHITFEHSAVCLPVTETRFENRCQFASVSSFGVSGTNVHMILENC